MNPTYPEITISPNLGLDLTGQEALTAVNFLIIDTFLGSNSGSGGGSSAWSALTGVLSNGQVIPYADAGISRLGSASLAIGNGTAGDSSGLLMLGSMHVVSTQTTNQPFVWQADITFNPALNNANLFTENINITAVPATAQSAAIIGVKVLTQLNGTNSMTGDTSCFEAINLWNSSGLVSVLRGFESAVIVNGGTATRAVGYEADVRGNGSGTTDEIDGFFAQDTNQTGVVTNWYGYRVAAPTFAGGSIAHFHGIHVDDITPGGANNPDPWAIFVAGGNTHLQGVVLASAAPIVALAQVGIGSTTAATATVGGGQATPATVTGYLVINVAGTLQKIPYYNA